MYEYTVQRYSRQALLLTSIPYRGTGTPTGTAPYELHVHVRASEFNHTKYSIYACCTAVLQLYCTAVQLYF